MLANVKGRGWSVSNSGALGLGHGRCGAGPGARAPRGLVALRLKPPQPKEPVPCRAPHGSVAWPGRRASAEGEGLVRRPRVRLMGSSSASLTSHSAPAYYPSSTPILPMLRLINQRTITSSFFPVSSCTKSTLHLPLSARLDASFAFFCTKSARWISFSAFAV